MTCVARPEKSLVQSLVLAKSLRRTQTTKRLAVIITTQVGKSEADALYNAFDDVFCLNENLILPLNTSGTKVTSYDGKVDELRGKIFAFSLEVYDKCVFVSSDTIFLENCDKMFEETSFLGTDFLGAWDNFFLFSPKRSVCQYLKERYEQCMSHGENGTWDNFITNCMQAWTKNNDFEDQGQDIADLSTAKFCMKTGRTIGAQSYNGLPSVVQFVDADLCGMEFKSRLKQFLFESNNLGLLNKVIRYLCNIYS